MKRWPLSNAHFWQQAPFIRLFVPLAAGILFYGQGWLCGLPGSYAAAIVSALLLAYGIAAIRQRQGTLPPLLFFVLANALLLVGGYTLSYYNDVHHSSTWFGNRPDTDAAYVARIADVPAEKEHAWKLPVRVLAMINNGHATAADGQAFVYLYKGRQTMLLHKGDTVLLPGKWEPVTNAGNPAEFDYAQYCRWNGICYRQYCAPATVRLFATADSAAAPLAEKCHDWCIEQLHRHITAPRTRGLIEAMLLGDEVNLDEDLRQAFTNTGIVHIIAISGGNITVFFCIIAFLLSRINKDKYGWVTYVLAFPAVWFYVVMAGAPPSAVRAAIMFSLVALSAVGQKNQSSLNTLFAAGFLLLCIRPMWLYAIGFQLSFIAVLSLIIFYGPVRSWYRPKALKWCWDVVAASIAAEVLTAPLAIFYFHTFPLLFIVANVAGFVFMNVVLIIAMIIIACSPFLPAIATCLGIITDYLVRLFYYIINLLQSCNPRSFYYISFSGAQLCLLYIAIAAGAVFLLRRHKVALFTGLAASCLLLALCCADEWQCLHQRRLVVYNTGKTTHIELINGTHCQVLRTDTTAGSKIAYAVRPAHTAWQAWRTEAAQQQHIYYIGGKTVLIIDSNFTPAGSFPVDYLVIAQPGNPDYLALQAAFTPTAIICAGKPAGKKQVHDTLSNTRIHITGTDGAFIIGH